jgi:hypothetical protein
MSAGLDENVGTGLLGVGDDLQRSAFCDVLALRAFPTRHRRCKQIGKAEQEPGLVGQEPMLEQSEQFLLGLMAVDIVKSVDDDGQGRTRGSRKAWGQGFEAWATIRKFAGFCHPREGEGPERHDARSPDENST